MCLKTTKTTSNHVRLKRYTISAWTLILSASLLLAIMATLSKKLVMLSVLSMPPISIKQLVANGLTP